MKNTSNNNTSRIVQRSDGNGGYINDTIFNCHAGTMTVYSDNCGSISSTSDFKYGLDDDGMDNTEYFAAIDGIEAMVVGLVAAGCVGYKNGQITPEALTEIMNDAIQAANNL